QRVRLVRGDVHHTFEVAVGRIGPIRGRAVDVQTTGATSNVVMQDLTLSRLSFSVAPLFCCPFLFPRHPFNKLNLARHWRAVPTFRRYSTSSSVRRMEWHSPWQRRIRQDPIGRSSAQYALAIGCPDYPRVSGCPALRE